MTDRSVSVGTIGAHNLRILREGFNRHFPLPVDDIFLDLIAALDEIPPADVTPLNSN